MSTILQAWRRVVVDERAQREKEGKEEREAASPGVAMSPYLGLGLSPVDRGSPFGASSGSLTFGRNYSTTSLISLMQQSLGRAEGLPEEDQEPVDTLSALFPGIIREQFEILLRGQSPGIGDEDKLKVVTCLSSRARYC